MNDRQRLSASFRDPSGFIYRQDGMLYRQVNRVYQNHYDMLVSSGLYNQLTKSNMLIQHEEAKKIDPDENVYLTIKPETIEMITYPYEWCFNQLKDAALLTLDIQRHALDCGMTLKDASAYNIQFHHGMPVLIDTLSFEIYEEGSPWIAYRQFCQHFLAPLALAAYCDVRLQKLLMIYIDGVPLDLAVALLPLRSVLKFGLLTHLHLHASFQKGSARQSRSGSKAVVTKLGMIGLIDSLRSTVRSLHWEPKGTDWGNYYQNTNYGEVAFIQKTRIVKEFLAAANPSRVCDLGANTGVFSRVASGSDVFTISADYDPAAVDLNYAQMRKKQERKLLPLVIDLTNPSPGLGWRSNERDSFLKRCQSDLLMALALVHHLVITNNVPLSDLADFCASLASWLIVEFVPKSDSQVQRLLRNRQDIYPEYTQEGFEETFSQFFTCCRSVRIEGSQRILYLYKRKRIS
jgi:hypothetical protein